MTMAAFLEKVQARHVLTVWSFVSLTVIYTQRVSFNVALVAMVRHVDTAIDLGNNTSDCPAPKRPQPFNVSLSGNSHVGQYDWDPKTQGMLVGAFYYGYIASQVVGGFVTNLLGAKLVFTLSVLVSSGLTMAIPWAASSWPLPTFLLRLVTGLAQGLTYTAVYTIFGRWVPPQERSTLLAYVMTGNQVGSIVGMLATGFLCQYGFAGGWPSAFILLSSFGLFAAAMVFLLVHNHPAEHPRITIRELAYINENLPHLKYEKKMPVPWKAILTSVPVWALILAKAFGAWGYYTMLTRLPMYLDQAQHISIEKNGVINAIVYLAQSVTGVVAGYVADALLRRRVCSLTTIRKGFETVSLMGCALFVALIPQFGCNGLAVVVTLTLMLGMLGLIQGGDVPNVVDLAPDYAGTLFGISNGLAAVTGILAPLLAGVLLENEPGSLTRWSYVFYVSSALFVCGVVAFAFFSSAQVQPWSSAFLPPFSDEDGSKRSSLEVVVEGGRLDSLPPAVEKLGCCSCGKGEEDATRF